MAITPNSLRDAGFKSIETQVEKCEEYIDKALQESTDYNGIYKVNVEELPLEEDIDKTVVKAILKYLSNRYSNAGWRVQTSYYDDSGEFTLVDPKIYSYGYRGWDPFPSIESMFTPTFKRLMLT